jgi:hypothetical protein
LRTTSYKAPYCGILYSLLLHVFFSPLDANHPPSSLFTKERKGKERKGKERKGKERKGKERKGKERKGKERKASVSIF